jgi:hypothetical protein
MSPVASADDQFSIGKTPYLVTTILSGGFFR